MNLDIKGKFMLLYANHYNMIGADGKAVEGISASYIVEDNLNPVANSVDEKGFCPSKGAIPLECLDKIKEVPGFYNGTFAMRAQSDGKTMLSIVDLEFDSLISVTPSKAAVSDKKGA